MKHLLFAQEHIYALFGDITVVWVSLINSSHLARDTKSNLLYI